MTSNQITDVIEKAASAYKMLSSFKSNEIAFKAGAEFLRPALEKAIERIKRSIGCECFRYGDQTCHRCITLLKISKMLIGG